MPSGLQSSRLPSSPQWSLLGCGALGGVFASLLTQSGQSTRVLLRDRHRSTLHPGIDFTSLEGQTQLIAIERGFVDQPGQIKRLLVMTKAGQVVSALTPLAGKLAAGVPIVLLHNGMGIAEQVVQLFPHNPVIAGVTSHGAMQSGHFVFRHTGKGETWLGPVNEAARAHASLAEDLTAALGQAGWDEQILARQWQKLAINCAINPLTALYKLKNGELAGPRFADALQQICVEVADVMQAEGQPTSSDELLRRAMTVVELTADNYSSMHQDMEQGRETEIEAITGFLLACAAKHGIAVPVNQGLYQAIKEKS
ncbi:TPA: 2-dehydropantoate 2-reductase [Aeromonas salmonicida]|uniref:ketopantoate reductase family protein n=1 Tax=Aeromonas salmonicida TaxID=645 RepID=UPI0002FE0082|nr:2-dehydropantoate 2-reductase [Aeromonas salmonicida]ASI24131.1 2-dehydropantoate 2-reductase [Aeromonas salmonicida]ASI28449.1 2-dehydropantoate 2-reductase [Aeromonas salmonicida]ASI32579.1 2-dehydropantoate 2-reductase [Aeromonas salmonicida]ATD39898.1 2-dehydropantoate 2-reductase [Aeromonas salmonicida subsp. masoucida]ELI6416803.1 2-dehydropantoate 2-reductase [Aeromonas salmonicida subsp. salmonicida]